MSVNAQTSHEGSDSSPMAEAHGAIDRMRDLAKWLVIVLGAIGGVLVTGAQLSDLGSTDHSKVPLAIAGVGACIFGVGIAITFTAIVLMPVRLTVAGLASRAISPVRKLVRREPDVLGGYGNTIAELQASRSNSLAAESAALDALLKRPNDETLRIEAEERVRLRQLIDKASRRFLAVSLVAVVKRRMTKALIALGVGGILVVAGLGLFAWATHSGKTSIEAEEAVPKRPSPVVVRLSEKGRESLSPSLGGTCGTTRLHAIALGGTPAAVEMVTLPTQTCQSVRFTLTNSFGTAENEETAQVRARQ